MNKLLFLFCVVTAFLNAQNTKNISGLYGECENGFYTCEQLNLKGDSSFEYLLWIEGGKVLEGYWQLNLDTIILNTFAQPKQLKPFIIDAKGLSADSISVLVYSYDSLELGFAEITLNGLQKFLCDSVGFVRIPSQSLKSITARFLFDSVVVSIDENSIDKLTLFIPLRSGSIPDYLINERWLVRKNRLFPFRNKSSTFEMKYFLQKTDTKHKKIKNRG